MKELTDEILNKYIDNELSSLEIAELKSYLENNPDALEKFKAHNLVDEILNEMEYESAPENFTESFMKKFSKVVSEKPKRHYFIWAVFGFLGAGFLGIFLFGLSNISSSESSRTTQLFNKIEKGFDEFIPSLVSFNFSVDSDLLLLIVSTLVLITLIATYGIVNSHKAFKDKIENLSH